jgi:hypothetical protein
MPNLPLPTTTIYPFWGAAYATNIQTYNRDGSIPTQWLSSDTLSATVSPGQNEASIFSPTVTWFNAAMGQVALSMTAAQTAMLAIEGDYWLTIYGTRSGTTYPIAWLWVQVVPAAGSQAAASPPDLITLAYANRLLGALTLTPDQFEQIPTLITAASAAWRSWCGRYFTQATIVEDLVVELDGYVALHQIPCYQVNRVQVNPSTAITIWNSSATSAWVSATNTGSLITGLTLASLVLNWEASGNENSQAIAITAGQTITSLASSITAVGNGWMATADSVLGAWPALQICDAYASKGATANDTPTGSAQFSVYSSNVTNSYFHPDRGQETGMLYVGRQNTGSFDPSWGPTYGDAIAQTEPKGKARVTYPGGFPTVPYDIQKGVLDLVKICLEQLKNDLLLSSEKAKDYSYNLALDMIEALPKNIRQVMAMYRIHNG